MQGIEAYAPKPKGANTLALDPNSGDIYSKVSDAALALGSVHQELGRIAWRATEAAWQIRQCRAHGSAGAVANAERDARKTLAEVQERYAALLMNL